MTECGFNKDVAVIVDGALAEAVNEKFGDDVNVAACVAGVKQFLSSGVDLNCRSCGWRKPKSIHCTQRCLDTSDGDTCEEFRHVFVMENK